MSTPIQPGTICILTGAHISADAGRLVVVVRYVGARQLGPRYMPEAYLTRCVAGRVLHYVRLWRPDGTFVDRKNQIYAALADRSELRPLPGIENAEDVATHQERPVETTV